MKPFSIDDIREVFVSDAARHISITKERLAQYLNGEGQPGHLVDAAIQVHTLKGVSATVSAWGLSYLASDFETLYEVAQSFHLGEPQRAKEIAEFLAGMIPKLEDAIDKTLGSDMDGAMQTYREVREKADERWGGYLPRHAGTFMQVPQSVQPGYEELEGAALFRPEPGAMALARSLPQPGIRVLLRVDGSQAAQPEPQAKGQSKPKETPTGSEEEASVLVTGAVPGMTMKLPQPQLRMAEEVVDEEWTATDSVPEQMGEAEPVELETVKPGGRSFHPVAPPVLKIVEEPSSDSFELGFTPETVPQPLSMDDEMVVIFREEAREYLDALAALLPKATAGDRSEECWAEIRRFCHTLKGSAAVVGLNEVSERGLTAESLARTALDEPESRTPRQAESISALASEIAALLGLGWAGRADAASSELDRVLIDAFLADCSTQLDDLEAATLAWERGENPVAQRQGIYRAFHTLKGAANSVGLSSLGASLHAAEDLLEQAPAESNASLIGFLLRATDALRAYAAQLATHAGAKWQLNWNDEVVRLGHALAAPSAPSPAPQPMEAVVMADPDRLDADLVRAFSFDARDGATQCETAVLSWERGESPADQIAAAYRVFHTLKGSANSVGLTAFARDCHAIEALIDRAGKREDLTAPPLFVEFLLQAADQIGSYAEAIQKDPTTAWTYQWQDRVLELAAAIEGKAEAVVQPPTPPPVIVDDAAVAADYVRIEAERIRNLLNQTGELIVERNRFTAKLERAIQLKQLLAGNRYNLLRLVENFQDTYEYSSLAKGGGGGGGRSLSFGSKEAETDSDFSELELDRYDEFNMFARSLNEVADDLGQVTMELESLIDSFRTDEKRFATNTRVMQEDIMRMTSQPVDGLFRRLGRSFRDALQLERKDAVLLFEGARSTMDRSMMERLYTPLLHLVRNAVAHGIEKPEVRESTGKPRRGTVTLSASQSANQFIVSVRDDGHGISPEAVLARAKERGLLPADKDSITPAETLEMLFTPGFSTASSVSQVAGRGIGLDVVKREIEEMRGSVSVDWEPGQGTIWKVMLPLTLAVSEAIVIDLAGQEFAIPLNFTESGLLLDESRITERAGHERYLLPDGSEVPLIRLGNVFGTPSKADYLRGVIISAGDMRAVLQVDDIHARREIVVKGLDALLAKHPYLEGATIDSQGRPMLIISIAALLRDASRGVEHRAAAVSEGGEGNIEDSQKGIVALVVDDSLSVRTVQTRLLSDLGCEVLLAVDGLDALEKLRGQRPDIIFSDLEMPRMNGYDLISAVRSNPDQESIPIVLVTSRAAQKHLDRAMQLGATAYLTKPFTKEDLASMLNRHTSYALATA